MFMHAQRKKLACSCNQRAFKDNVINYVVCLVVVPSFPSFHLERLAELETESMLVFSTRKAQEKKEKLSRKVSSGSVFTTQVNTFQHIEFV